MIYIQMQRPSVSLVSIKMVARVYGTMPEVFASLVLKLISPKKSRSNTAAPAALAKLWMTTHTILPALWLGIRPVMMAKQFARQLKMMMETCVCGAPWEDRAFV